MHFAQRIAVLAACIGVAAAPAALAQEWPARPIRVVIPNVAGSVSEPVFRAVSPTVEAKLGQRFLLENKPGAAGNIGTAEVVRAAPDGYTLLLAPTANYAVTPHLFKDIGYDPLTQLDPITLLAEAPLLTIVNTNVPAKTLKELIDYVRANPGKFNYGSPGTGSPAHLTGAFFSQLTGDALVYVPYKGTPPMVQALMANDIQIAFPTLTGVISMVRSGRLKALAVMATQRMVELPDVPTSAEAGFPQLLGGNWWVLSAPHGTSPNIIARLASEFRAALAIPEARKRIASVGHVPIGLTPGETAAFLKSESARYKTVVEKGGIKTE